MCDSNGVQQNIVPPYHHFHGELKGYQRVQELGH